MIYYFIFLLFAKEQQKQNNSIICKIDKYDLKKSFINILQNSSTYDYNNEEDLIFLMKVMYYFVAMQGINNMYNSEDNNNDENIMTFDNESISFRQCVQNVESAFNQHLASLNPNAIEQLRKKFSLYIDKDAYYAREYYIDSKEDNYEQKIQDIINSIKNDDFDFSTSASFSKYTKGEIGVIIPSALYKDIEIKDSILCVYTEKGCCVLYLHKPFIADFNDNLLNTMIKKSYSKSFQNYEYCVEYLSE